ncbi:MAG: hypothetical protein M3Q54_11775 [Actinomycetota bacterium]|jgi:hypothetical protein|nr:hypothetical protein [Actinomycetota bacterium]
MSEAKTENSLESLREEKSWLRFSRLSRTEARRLRHLFWRVDEFWDVRVHPRSEDIREFIATVRLREDVEYGWLKGFVEEGAFGEEDYGVAVSVVTDNPTPIAQVPKFVAELGKEIGGFVELSFHVV